MSTSMNASMSVSTSR